MNEHTETSGTSIAHVSPNETTGFMVTVRWPWASTSAWKVGCGKPLSLGAALSKKEVAPECFSGGFWVTPRVLGYCWVYSHSAILRETAASLLLRERERSEMG